MKRTTTRLFLTLLFAAGTLFLLQSDVWSPPVTAAGETNDILTQAPARLQGVVQASSLPYTTFVEATFADPLSLDPALDYETAGWHVVRQVYETLLIYNRDKSDQYLPMLATSWSMSPDGRTYTFTIRSGVQFHNGASLAPEDVAFTFWRGMLAGDPNTPQYLLAQPLFDINDITQLVEPNGSLIGDPDALKAQPPALLQAACMTVTNAVAFDNAAGTVVFHLARPWGPFLDTLVQPWGSVLDKDWLIANGAWDDNCATWQNYYATPAVSSTIATIANGTGPFKLDHWTPDSEIVLMRTPNYWRQTPAWPNGPSGLAALERIEIKNVPTATTRYEMFLNGDADSVALSSAADAAQFEDYVLLRYAPDGSVRSLQYTTGTLLAYDDVLAASATDFLFTYDIDTSGPRNYVGSGLLDGNGIPPDFFSDIHVRKAFNYAFDWTQYISDVYSGQAIQRRGPFIKGILGYTDTQPTYFFSRTLAMLEMSQAWGGQVVSNGFAMTLSYNLGNTQRQRVSEILKSGIEGLTTTFHVNVVGIPWPDYLTDLRASNLPMFTGGWLQDIAHPHNWVEPYLYGIYASRQRLPADYQDTFRAKASTCVQLVGAAAQLCYEDIQNTTYLSATDIFLAQTFSTKYLRAEVRGFYANLGYVNDLYFYVLSKGLIPPILYLPLIMRGYP